MTKRRKTAVERRLEKELKEELANAAFSGGYYMIKNFGYALIKFFANFLAGLFVMGLSYPQGTIWGTLFAFLCGFMIIPAMRWISDRL